MSSPVGTSTAASASEEPTSWPARCVDAAARWASVTSGSSSICLALDAAVAEHDHDGRRGRRQPDDLHAAHGDRLGPRTDHDGGVVGQVGEEVRRAVQHLLEAPVGGAEELPDLAARRGVETAGRGQVVDEEAVPLVGRDPPGRRVRLDEVALLLEHGHLVADRGRRHPDPGRVGDVGRTHRERRGDVLLDDGAQDRGLAVVEHAGSPGYRVLTARRWLQVGDAGAIGAVPAADEDDGGRRRRRQGDRRCRTPGPTRRRRGRRRDR